MNWAFSPPARATPTTTPLRKTSSVVSMRVCPPAPFLRQKTCYDGHIRLHRSFLQSCAPPFLYWQASSGRLRNFLIQAFCRLNEGQRVILRFILFFESFYCPLNWEGLKNKNLENDREILHNLQSLVILLKEKIWWSKEQKIFCYLFLIFIFWRLFANGSINFGCRGYCKCGG